MIFHFKMNWYIWKYEHFDSHRSVQVFYPKSDVQNANMRWYWSVVAGMPNPNDMIHDSLRPTNEGNILNDYVLLEKYRKGRYLQATTTTGLMTIAEVLMTFAEMRKARERKATSVCSNP